MLTIDNRKKILDRIRALTEAHGLALLGVASLEPEPDAFGRFHRWLEAGRHAGMGYLAENLALRRDPRALLPGARAAIVIALPYFLGDKAPLRGVIPGRPRIAQYARLKDYHRLLWRRGEAILRELIAAFDPQAVGRVVTDSAPLLERALAARTGAGFIGKNTCFIHPEQGSFLLLGEILTSLALPVEAREPVDPTRREGRGGCGSCRRCQVHCPTGALDQAYSLDANLCLAYWTIENRGTIPERFWPWLGQYLFGCDICQLVCPYNRRAAAAVPTELVRLETTPPLFDVATMTPDRYQRLFGGTPLTRAKRPGLMRNALIAMTVGGDARLDEALAVVAGRETDAMLVATLAQIRAWRDASAAGGDTDLRPRPV